jgi:hypothetical protein
MRDLAWSPFFLNFTRLKFIKKNRTINIRHSPTIRLEPTSTKHHIKIPAFVENEIINSNVQHGTRKNIEKISRTVSTDEKFILKLFVL